jgi:hypothetical protein
MQDEHQEAVVELRALRSSTTQVRDLVLKRSHETSSLAVSLSSTADQVEDCVDTAATNRVHWGAQSALIAALSHFPELEPELEHELELVGFGCNADLAKGQLNAL